MTPAVHVQVTLPLRLPSLANQRLHHMARHRLLDGHKGTAFAAVRVLGRGLKPPLTISLTRIGPRRLDPDNLAGSFKGVQDGVALALGVDDGDERVTWSYGQRRATAGEPRTVRGYGVVIEIRKGVG